MFLLISILEMPDFAMSRKVRKKTLLSTPGQGAKVLCKILK